MRQRTVVESVRKKCIVVVDGVCEELSCVYSTRHHFHSINNIHSLLGFSFLFFLPLFLSLPLSLALSSLLVCLILLVPPSVFCIVHSILLVPFLCFPRCLFFLYHTQTRMLDVAREFALSPCQRAKQDKSNNGLFKIIVTRCHHSQQLIRCRS